MFPNNLVCLLAVATLLGSSACSKPATGVENGPCYANNTCNTGLTCFSNTCVNASGDASSPTDGFNPADLSGQTSDAATFNDAGMPCPGATINHPGTETRNVGTSVPFVGLGRDSMCMPIMGANLVWTDSLEGQIGTGGTFNYTFTMTGSHTVTLTAKSGGLDVATATVTFLIQ